MKKKKIIFSLLILISIFVLYSGNVEAVAINGVCGNAVGKEFSVKPTEGFCQTGESRGVSEIRETKEWKWTCYGKDGGGDSAICIAKIVASSVTNNGLTTSQGPVIDASSEEGGLVPACPAEGCGFNEFMELINNVIKFLLFTIATPLAALVFVYAGIMLITAGGDSGKMTTAKKILLNLVVGYLIALSAWLVINTILTSEFLGYDGPTFLKK
jgi:hypothetical protein